MASQGAALKAEATVMRNLQRLAWSVAIIVVSLLVVAVPAAAQLAALQSGTTGVSTAAGDVAYDPTHDAYLIVHATGLTGAQNPSGRFVSGSGTTIYGSANSPIGADDHVPESRAAFSPDLSDGAGGSGAFLVVWSARGLDSIWRVYAQVVAFPGRLVGPQIVAVTWRSGTAESIGRVDVAYSRTDRLFLLAWGVGSSYFDQTGHHGDFQSYYVRLDATGQPIGAATAVKPSHEVTCDGVRHDTCGHIEVEWNPGVNEFGFLYDDASLIFLRVRTDGSIPSRTTLGAGTSAHALAVNSRSHTYLAGFADPTTTRTAEIDVSGAIIRQSVVASTGVDPQYIQWLALSYSAVTGTFLLDVTERFSDFAVLARPGFAIEVDEHGAALSSPLVLASWWSPAVASRAIAPEWMITTPTGFSRIGSSTPRPPSVRGDLTGDGRADLIWQHPGSGAVVLWAMNGQFGSRSDPRVASFTADGVARSWTTDVSAEPGNWPGAVLLNGVSVPIGPYEPALGPSSLWALQWDPATHTIYQRTGDAVLPAGTTLALNYQAQCPPSCTGSTMLSPGGTLWQIAGAADFTGDGKPDLLWQHPGTGALLLWVMDGPTYVSSAILSAGGTDWRVAALGNFSGHAGPDIIWQHPNTGAVQLWAMRGVTYVDSAILHAGTAWQIVGAGDVTGDGHTDLLWQHPATGALLLWEMNGSNYVGSTILSPGGTYWKVVAIGDYTADGKPDIVWQHPTTGAVLLWQMDGPNYVASTFLSPGGSSWQVSGPR